MSGPFPLPTLAAQISATGISAPSYADILASLQASYQGIYGADANLDPNTPDGQWIAVLASAINDTNNACIAVYNSFSPASAQGAGLSSNVKINGLRRQVASNSTAQVTVVGVAYTSITNGVVADQNGNQWSLPASVQIPSGGSVVVTATCTVQGAITAAENTITQIVTPTRGWQSVTNAAAATPGAPVETDAALRQRQTISTSLPAQTPLEGIVAAVRNVSGVTAVQPYENDTSSTDELGIPAHSIALVVAGGDATAVATAIASKKSPGTGTYGSIQETIIDGNGVPDVINFSAPTAVRVVVALALTPLTGFVSTTEVAIQEAMSAWVAGLSIGDSAGVALNDLMAAAKLPAPLGLTYKIEYGALTIGTYGGSLGTSDIALAYDEKAGLAVSDITITT